MEPMTRRSHPLSRQEIKEIMRMPVPIFRKWIMTYSMTVYNLGVDASFHTNTRMTTWLLDDENLKRLAAAEAAAIAEHYGLKKTADEPQRAETVCYHLLSDVPQGDYRTVLDKLIAADILRGRSGTGEERVLDLTEDSVRLLVLLDRAGAFGS